MRSLYLFTTLFGISAYFLGAVAATAGPLYKADTLVTLFIKDKQAAEEAKKAGKKRKICFEGDADCAPAQSPARVDLFVTFEFDSNNLTPEAKANLDQFALALKDPSIKGTKFSVDGFTDAKGGEDYNLGLSERRAQAVVAYLASRGVDASTLVAKGYGKTKPRVPDDPLSADNRRVETHLAE